MTWFKVDDSFHSHPKVIAASPAALGLWVVAGSWSSGNLQDGFVPDHVLQRLLPDSAPLAKELVTCGLWKRTRGGHLFHDFGDYNPEANAIRQRREEARERMKKVRGNRKGAAHDADGSHEHSRTGGERSHVVREPRPDPTRSSYGTSGDASDEAPDAPTGTPPKARRAHRLPDDFKVSPEMVEWARQRCPLIDGKFQTELFINHWTSAADTAAARKLDWTRTWRNWLLRAQKWAEERAPTTQAVVPKTSDERCPHHPHELAGFCRRCPDTLKEDR